MSQKVLLTSKEVNIILHRLACQLIENHLDFSNSVLIGIQPRGVSLAQRLKTILETDYNINNIPLGFLDITFFRDDFRRGEKQLEANKTQIDFLVEDKKVVFIDDVLFTGRSIRAALTAADKTVIFTLPMKKDPATRASRKQKGHPKVAWLQSIQFKAALSSATGSLGAHAQHKAS